MANTHAILAIVASILAALTATVFGGIAILLPALFVLGAGIFILTTASGDKLQLASGAIAAVLGLVATLGALNGINIGGVSFDFSAIGGSMAAAIAIFGCIEIAAARLKTVWADLPPAGAYVTAGALAIGVVLAFVFNVHMNAYNVQNIVVALLPLAGLYPAIVSLND